MKLLRLLSAIIIGIPIVGYQAPGKVVYLLFLVIQSFRRTAIALLLCCLASLILCSLFIAAEANINWIEVLFDVTILANLALVLYFRNQNPVKSVTPIALILLLGVFAQSAYGLLMGNTQFVERYGMSVLQLGGGTASMSMLFGILLLIAAWSYFYQHQHQHQQTANAQINLNQRARLLAISICVISVCGLVFSAGRAPLVAAGLILITSYRQHWKRWTIPFLIFIGLFTSSDYYELLASRTHLSSLDAFIQLSMTGRWPVYQETVSIVLNNGGGWQPCVGCKAEILSLVSDRIGRIEDQFHSEPLRLFTMFGWIGPIIYLIFLMYFSHRVFFKPNDLSLFQQLTLYLLLVGLTDNTLIYVHFWLIAFQIGRRSSV